MLRLASPRVPDSSENPTFIPRTRARVAKLLRAARVAQLWRTDRELIRATGTLPVENLREHDGSLLDSNEQD